MATTICWTPVSLPDSGALAYGKPLTPNRHRATAMTDPAPLATYTERLLQVRRDFALYPDRVEVRAAWLLGKRQQTTVPLADLTARSTEFFVRNRWAKRALMLGSLAVAAAVVFGRPGQSAWAQRASLVGWAVAGVCALVFARTLRKVRFVRLLKPDGKAGLDLAQAGPDAARFEAFLAAVRKQILAAGFGRGG